MCEAHQYDVCVCVYKHCRTLTMRLSSTQSNSSSCNRGEPSTTLWTSVGLSLGPLSYTEAVVLVRAS